MIHVAVRVRELVSSNIEAMLTKATDPAKALRLLRSEVEETLISLHSELTMTSRQQERSHSRAASLAAEAETWTGKAAIAVDHGREDLARAALLARENGLADAAMMREEANKLAKDVAELEAAIADLDTKRTDIITRAAQCATGVEPAPTGDTDVEISRTARRLDRIDELQRRLDYKESARAPGSQAALADTDSEIAALSQASMIDAELLAMKAVAKERGAKSQK